jgi:hypothetical protein
MLEGLGPLIGKRNSRTLQHSIGWWSNRRKELLPQNKKACTTRAPEKIRLAMVLWLLDKYEKQSRLPHLSSVLPKISQPFNVSFSSAKSLSSLRKQNFTLREQYGMCYRSKSSTPKTERSTVPVFDLESNHLKRFPAIVLNGNSRSRVTYVVHC